MSFSLLRRSYPTLEELEAIRNQRTMGIRRVMGVSGLILLGFVSFLGTMLVLQPMLELQQLRQQQAHAEYLLKRARAEAHSRYLWMTDPEYYEQLARDRADMAREGEVIIRRPSPADLRRMQQEKKNKKPRRSRD